MERVAYMGFKGVAWIIFAIVLLQFFFAGIVVFGQETWGESALWPHRIAGWLVILFGLVLLILAAISFFTGGMRGRTVGMAALLFVLSFVQLVLAAAYYMGFPIIAALHPVNALILLGLSFHLARGARSESVKQTATARVQ
jgi:hypothetical protein